MRRRLCIVGATGLTTLGSSFARAADDLGVPHEIYDVGRANSSHRLLNAVAWRLGPRLPPFPGRVMRDVHRALAADGEVFLLTTGLAPVRASDLSEARNRGALTMHFSSDDPWNSGLSAPWYMRALVEYDFVFTPRRNNLDDLAKLGCRQVRYLPFAYDPAIFPQTTVAESTASNPMALFVGGADADRAEFFRGFVGAGGEAALVGGYWDRYADLAGHWLGHLEPEEVAELTRSAAVNLILVRRANRDGHTMRSFEAAAIGGCLLVEDTTEHRAIFGPDGLAVRYFDSPAGAAALHQLLSNDRTERLRMARAVQNRIRDGGNTYADRLKTMLAATSEQCHNAAPSEACDA